MITLFSLSYDVLPHLLNAVGQIDPSTVQECLGSTFSNNSTALSCGSQFSEYTAQQWDAIWQQKVGAASPEFVAAMNISRYVAGPAVALWGITALRNLARNGLADSWQQMAAVSILVLVLYADNASVMRQTTLAARQLINYQNQSVLQLANEGNQFEKKLAEITDYRLSESAIIAQRDQCNGIENNAVLLACLENANVRAQAIIDDYYQNHPGGKLGAVLTDYVRDVIANPVQFLKDNGVTIVATTVGGPAVGTAVAVAGKVATSGVSLAAQGILASMTYVTANIIELAWLFTAIILPIPLALSFYPGGRSALVGWAVSFLTLGLFKINLNMASSLIVSMIYERGPGEPTIDLLLLSLGVIVLALGMTAGGGLAIFNGITTAMGQAAGFAVQLGATAAGVVLPVPKR
ncbi:MAG: hypothetical protein AAF703_22200 [Cyanobacteria bacterium P01_D01_bin.105]